MKDLFKTETTLKLEPVLELARCIHSLAELVEDADVNQSSIPVSTNDQWRIFQAADQLLLADIRQCAHSQSTRLHILWPSMHLRGDDSQHGRCHCRLTAHILCAQISLTVSIAIVRRHKI